jgi:hypothetical protein
MLPLGATAGFAALDGGPDLELDEAIWLVDKARLEQAFEAA